MDKCGLDVSEIIEAAIPDFLRGGNRALATAERPQPASPVAYEHQPSNRSEPVSNFFHSAPTAAPVKGSDREPDAPLAGIVVEPTQMDEPVTGSIPATTLPEAPITGSLQERAQGDTPPNT
jgi:hypothetical protein